MTREEAIKELQSYADASWGGLNEAFELAIDALKNQHRKIIAGTEITYVEVPRKSRTGVSKGRIKCTECVHYKDCRSKRDLRRKYSKCPLASGEVFATNADHIRSMTDEQLSEFLSKPFCENHLPKGKECMRFDTPDCEACVADWLKQPYEEET
jgi:hypothetical protein